MYISKYNIGLNCKGYFIPLSKYVCFITYEAIDKADKPPAEIHYPPARGRPFT